MYKFLLIFGKITSLIQIVFGILIIYINLKFFKYSLNIVMEYSGLTWNKISMFKLLADYQFMILVGLAFIVSGILMLLSKGLGWAIGIAAWIILVVLGLTLIIFNDVTTTIMYTDNFQYWIFGLMMMVCFVCISILISKPLREKFQIGRKHWFYLGMTLLFFFFNNILI